MFCPIESDGRCYCNPSKKIKKKRWECREFSMLQSSFSVHHKTLAGLQKEILSVNKKEESENKCTTFQYLNFFLITEYSTNTKRHKIIFLYHSTKAGSFRLETLHIKRHTILQTTYRGLFVNWLYDKLLVIERDVSYFTPRKTNLGCQPSKRKSSH